jgi:hypothetical protein
MEHLDHPSTNQWEARKGWFESHIFHYEELGSYVVGEQASALLAEVESCFCAGAWAAVIIIAFAVVETNLEETNGAPEGQRAVDLLKGHGIEAALTKLRKSRNSLVHTRSGTPALTVDRQWDDRAALEAEARDAVELMFRAFYFEPGT